MKATIYNLDSQKVGEIELVADIFGQDERPDILQRVVEWARAKKRSGNHKTKIISEVSGTGKKPWKQKGTGRARHGTLRSNQFRGGGIIFGPVVRSHEYSLNKKVRKLGLKVALSSKFRNGNLVIVDKLELAAPKTKSAVTILKNMGISSALFVDADQFNINFELATRNIPNICTLPEIGANVYDILKHEKLVLTKAALDSLVERLQ